MWLKIYEQFEWSVWIKYILYTYRNVIQFYYNKISTFKLQQRIIINDTIIYIINFVLLNNITDHITDNHYFNSNYKLSN